LAEGLAFRRAGSVFYYLGLGGVFDSIDVVEAILLVLVTLA